MQIVSAEAPGGPEVLTLREAPTPAPGPGQALVRVAAAGVNFIDVYQRKGQYAVPTPLRLGLEGAGRVEALGPGVSGLAPGDRVAWASVGGSYATHVVAPVEQLVPVPAGVDDESAAALMLQGMTAHYLCRSTYPLREGERCLVYAAAGGVGLLLCQMAKRLGARAVGVVSTPEKAELAREAGAAEVVVWGGGVDLAAEARALAGGRGFDVVYDSVGRDSFDLSLRCLRPRGMLVLYGQSSGPVAPFDPQRLAQAGSLVLTRPKLGDYTADRAELLGRAGELFDDAAAGRLRVRVGGRFPLARAADAHRALESRATTGKLLLVPG
ncbi:MAG TPA: quinone oxidoreductase [Polyangiaceae bacterium]|nr:quinone oxidoreductase [Polyangiaceae bacterium]